MVDWQQEILEAFNQGKTIQFKNTGEEWHDFERQNQLDKPNLNYGYKEQWRIKPNYDDEREQLLKDSGRDDIIPMMKEEKKYSREQMFLFAGFCVGKKMTNPGIDIGEVLDEFNATFGHG
jgi:hypothetical protein